MTNDDITVGWASTHLNVEQDEPDVQQAEAEVEAEVEAEATEEAPAAPAGRKPRSGYHTLQDGDTPSRVARRLYGSVSKAADLVRANPSASWAAGTEIRLP